jgi:YVTN family beta-propeller protein
MISVIDPAAMTVRGTVPTGSGPHGVVIGTSGTRAWVTNTYADTVSVVDLSTLSVAGTFTLGTISYSPRPPASRNSQTTQLNIPTPTQSR